MSQGLGGDEWMRSGGEVWECDNCGHVKLHEEEITCWKCGKGEMIFRGRIPLLVLVVWKERRIGGLITADSATNS